MGTSLAKGTQVKVMDQRSPYHGQVGMIQAPDPVQRISKEDEELGEPVETRWIIVFKGKAAVTHVASFPESSLQAVA